MIWTQVSIVFNQVTGFRKTFISNSCGVFGRSLSKESSVFQTAEVHG